MEFFLQYQRNCIRINRRRSTSGTAPCKSCVNFVPKPSQDKNLKSTPINLFCGGNKYKLIISNNCGCGSAKVHLFSVMWNPLMITEMMTMMTLMMTLISKSTSKVIDAKPSRVGIDREIVLHGAIFIFHFKKSGKNTV